MKILFISLSDFYSFDETNIYTDLLKEFINNGHNVTAISPVENDKKLETKVFKERANKIIKPQIYPIKKQSYIKKGINTLLFPIILLSRIKNEVKFEEYDWVIYPTPPTSLTPIIKKIKKKNSKIKSYLLLKDIFPQNAIDLGIMHKGLVYYYFRKQEKELYCLSDLIGCMSPKNKEYILNHNPFIDTDKVSIVPNSMSLDKEIKKPSSKKALREKWKLPNDKKIYVYAGNFGKPQNIDFLISNMNALLNYKDEIHFVFCGAGTDAYKIRNFSIENPELSTYLGHLSKEESDEIVKLSDFALVLLSPKFTIPNIPSRLLTYFKFSKPILAATDINTDVKDLIVNNHIGYWTESVDDNLKNIVEKSLSISNKEYNKMSNNSREVLEKKFDSKVGYQIILKEMSGFQNV